jgi:hypothetical protein
VAEAALRIGRDATPDSVGQSEHVDDVDARTGSP